jgi:mono/diheme cytochrome c family protein
VSERGRWLLVFLSLACAPTLAAQEGTSRLRAGGIVDTDEDGQPMKLPPLPKGMTVAMIREGDSLFRGKGGCVTCHGQEANGMPAMGSSLTGGLSFIPIEWATIDSLIIAGIPEPITRTPIAMPPRGAKSDLSPEESRLIAAYVWAISQTRDEPWPGGHATHGPEAAQAAPAAEPRGPGS